MLTSNGALDAKSNRGQAWPYDRARGENQDNSDDSDTHSREAS